MDFQFTSRPSTNTRPVWATSHDDAEASNDRIFGTNLGSPFLFNTPTSQTPHAHPWAPPPLFSPEKAFPQPQIQDVCDVNMSEFISSIPEEDDEDVATGELRRVFRARPKQVRQSHNRRDMSDAPFPRLKSTDAPMDFQFTSRPSSNVKPAWATSWDDAETSKHSMLGTSQKAPFLFNTPTPQTLHAHPWAPPPSFSPEKAFPQPQFQDVRDVDMSEFSPPNPEEDGGYMTTGGLRRVFKARQKRTGRDESDNSDPSFSRLRSTEAPMDFQYASRPRSSTKPVWAWDDAETSNHNVFGADRDTPTQTLHTHPWAPPPLLSPKKALSSTLR